MSRHWIEDMLIGLACAMVVATITMAVFTWMGLVARLTTFLFVTGMFWLGWNMRSVLLGADDGN